MEALPPAPVAPEWRAIVDRVLAVWSAYQLGVEQQSGGDETSEKHVWFGDVLADHIANSRGLNADGLEEWITSILYQDFDLVLEDDSTYPTSHLLLEAHGYWKSGERVRLTHLLSTLPSEERVEEARRASRRGVDQEEVEGEEGETLEEEEDEDRGTDDDDKPKRDRAPRTVVDDDGWTTVNKR
ncbi:hypothetical protein PFISCL1PPCAC_13056 [Pristionchus fissidentatus]|uniref:Pre-rRNA-processing protein TSR2 homolog n=1 Tax=Pristionchus fissidentatus TaxID=1538716 RepID=A0AAV5VVG8_9BILA|nr:hypothetical protein PFISCL1PPCAC_13056 [Pristionchus fissidentatus]